MWDKVQIFELNPWPPPSLALLTVIDHPARGGRKVYEEKRAVGSAKFWVAKKCRCITCDLIRLTWHQGNRSYGAAGGERRVDMKYRYDRITYIGGSTTFGSQWKTQTVSQIEPLSVKGRKALKKKHMKV